MADPVLPTLSGSYSARHLKKLKHEIYIIMVVFGFAQDNRIMLEELSFRIRGLSKYSHLSRDQVKEMLAQSASISFLFSSHIDRFEYIIDQRLYDAMSEL